MSKTQRILAELGSWKSGYIAPSAAMLMGDAEQLIKEQLVAIEALDAALEDARKHIDELRAQIDTNPVKTAKAPKVKK
jgi:hypothetical protein